MGWRNGEKILLALLVALVTTLAPSWLSRAEREQVEADLALFMCDFIVDNYLVTQGEQTGLTASSVPGIIIWAPPGKNPHSPTEFADRYRPIRVWLSENGQLIEQSNMVMAIEAYRQTYMNYPGSESWAFYDFTIESISRKGQQAEVYVGASCGPMCGLGTRYTLQWTAAAGWEITGSEWVWIT